MMVECVFIFLFVLSAVPQPRLCATCSLRESSEKLVSRFFPRGPRTPKDEEVTLGVGRPRNPEGDERCMRALGTRGVAITARGTNHSSFHLNMRTRFGSRPPVTTNIFSITGRLVRVSHRFCLAPVPYRPVNTPNVERATSWRFQRYDQQLEVNHGGAVI